MQPLIHEIHIESIPLRISTFSKKSQCTQSKAFFPNQDLRFNLFSSNFSCNKNWINNGPPIEALREEEMMLGISPSANTPWLWSYKLKWEDWLAGNLTKTASSFRIKADTIFFLISISLPLLENSSKSFWKSALKSSQFLRKKLRTPKWNH